MRLTVFNRWPLVRRCCSRPSQIVGTPQVSVLPDDDLLRRRDAEALLVRAAMPALDDLVARLVGAGVGVRELAPVVAPLEAAFLALTGAPNGEDQ